MLSLSALQTAASRVATVFSPSKTGRVRVPSATGNMFRYDPYAFRVVASPVRVSAAATGAAACATALYQSCMEMMTTAVADVPAANRAFLDILKAPTAASAAPTVAAAAAPATAATVPASSSSTIRYAYIKFKHDTLVYIAPFRISVGDSVLVEGDRGEDIGTVDHITTDKPNFPVPMKVTRKATQKDQELLAAKRQREAAAVRTTQALADSLDLAMEIADCEFQLDYGKLTVYFRTKQRYMDFRKLQRGLFREFRCRIWLTESNRHIAAEKKVPAVLAH